MKRRSRLVPLVLATCAAVAAGRLALAVAAPLWGERGPVEMSAEAVVRCRTGQAVLVLREKNGSRRLPIAVGAQEALAIEQRLRGLAAPDLAAASIRALGARVLRVSVDALGNHNAFLGHLTLAGASGEVELDAPPQSSVPLALDAGAPILVAPAVLDEASITDDDLRSLHALDRARSVGRDREPLHTLKI